MGLDWFCFGFVMSNAAYLCLFCVCSILCILDKWNRITTLDLEAVFMKMLDFYSLRLLTTVGTKGCAMASVQPLEMGQPLFKGTMSFFYPPTFCRTI